MRLEGKEAQTGDKQVTAGDNRGPRLLGSPGHGAEQHLRMARKWVESTQENDELLSAILYVFGV